MNQKLRKIRKGLGYTQADMARHLATPVSTYIKWETGARRAPGILWVALRLIAKGIEKNHNKNRGERS